MNTVRLRSNFGECPIAPKIRSMTGYKSGAATRRAILLALLEREPRTVKGLAAEAGCVVSNAWRTVGLLERDGLVTVTRGMGRRGAAVTLTAAGRGAAQLLH